MATDETRPYIPVGEALPILTMAWLPEGTNAEALYMLIKLDDGNWCARTVGDTQPRRVPGSVDRVHARAHRG